MNYSRTLMTASLLLLAACSSGSVKSTLGLDRAAPDEFRVVSRPPLSVPPQFNLRPPSATDTSSNQLPTSKQAQSLMTGTNPAVAPENVGGPVLLQPADTAAGSSATPASGAESQFLKNAGANQADPKVRDKIMEDRIAAQQPPPEERSWWNFWNSDPAKKEPIVNANQEAQRIKTNEDSGQPVTQGETPVVKPRDTGVLGQIFGY